MENSQDRRTNAVAGSEHMNINHSRPNESTQDVEISTPRFVRAVRPILAGLPATVKASTLRAATGTTKSKGSSVQIAAIFINHPILAMLALGMIALIGLVCLFALPLR